MELPAPLAAHTGSTGHTRLASPLEPHVVGALDRHAMDVLAPAARRPWPARQARHHGRPRLGHRGRCWGTRARVHGPCGPARGRDATGPPRAPWRRAPHRGPNRGEGRGSAGYTPQTGEPGIASTDHPGSVCAPVPGAPGQETARSRLPTGRKALPPAASTGGLDRRGASVNRAGGGDARQPRKLRCKAGLIPHLTAPPRHRQPPQRGRTRVCHEAIQARRLHGERTVAWEDPFKRLRLRCERRQPRHDGMQVMASTLMNLREVCGI
jgi:hypothetical protein